MRAQFAALLSGEALLLSGLWCGVDWTVAAGIAGVQLVAFALFADFETKAPK